MRMSCHVDSIQNSEVCDMQFVYPAKFEKDPDGGILVTFPDVPEAITGGQDRKEARAMAEDALAVALLARVQDDEPLPAPSPLQDGLEAIAVPASVAAKLALIALWRRSGLSKSALARKLGVDEKVVRRMLDPDHKTSLSRLERAIQALGGRLVISTLEDHAETA
ncbi:type II toxin-antitoxin system HicB family antitoxin [Thermopetrobacter sp. TC1]|uniref:type II toxin-antitoxin system HicB family antitoxin n=1 Tax=Thermopetrobacter sp. TC1 TaxID=1495045 RepID=UPI003510CA9B